MSESLLSSLNFLKALSSQLNSVADETAQVVRDVEKVLDELNLGISASVEVDVHDYSQTRTDFFNLEYRRVKGKFRIAVITERVTDFTNDAGTKGLARKVVFEMPWLECGRYEKIATFEKLPELLVALIDKAKQTIAMLSKTIPEVRELLDTLK